MNSEKRTYKTEKAGDVIISQIIGPRPRKPATYARRRMDKNNKSHQDFCDNYDKKLQEWQEKADAIRKSEIKEYPDFVEKPNPEINISSELIIEDFKNAYKHIYKKEFKLINPHSESNEPEELLKTLVYYFNKDDRFFKSKLLNRGLSEPSFEKGTLVIGKYGCGKTSTYKTLVFLFKNYVKIILKERPSNMELLLSKFRIDQVVATAVVLEYKQALKDGKRALSDILHKTNSLIPLYIDDILKEEILFRSKDNETNIFKDALTLRDDRGFKSHLSLNYKEYAGEESSTFDGTEKSLRQMIFKYNGTVHDRLFGSYNIIELTSKSMRR